MTKEILCIEIEKRSDINDSTYQDITKFVKGTHASKAPIIPISAQSGLNVDTLIGSIESTIKTPTRDIQKTI